MNAMKNLMLNDHIDGTFIAESSLNSALFFIVLGLGTTYKPEELIADWQAQRDDVIVPRIREMYEREIEKSKYIIPFMAMECAASRVIECAISLDRYLYLIEHENVGAAIVPIFDKSKSPRNLAIVAWKKYM
jgi:hypothetical protein